MADQEAPHIPNWALGVLRRPGSSEPLTWSSEGLATADGAKVRLEDGIIDLAFDDGELATHGDRYPTTPPGRNEVLRPSQAGFRRLLGRFLASLPEGDVVAEIASGEAEFFGLYRHLRYIPMDLSVARIQRARRLGRVPFAVIADIRRLPLRPGSVDAVVSTNTLNHLPDELLPEVAQSLIAALRPRGRAAMTIRSDRLELILGALGDRARVVEIAGIEGPASSAWKRTIERAIDSVPSLPWRRASEVAVRGTNALALGVAQMERAVIRGLPRLWRQHWIELELAA